MNSRYSLVRLIPIVAALLLFMGLPARSGPQADGSKPDPKPEAKKTDKPKKAVEEKHELVRWGKRRSETDEQYDKRYATLLKKVEQDKHGDFDGGHFENKAGEKIRLWTYKGNPFIVRTDISKEFRSEEH